MNIVVIGLGSMGRRRIRLMKGICPEHKIVGVDHNQERQESVSKEYGIECFQSIQEAGEQIQIQCAFVCTSPLSHAPIIRECLMNGWHVFTEINLVTDGYEENMQLAKEKGLVLFLSSTPIYRAEMQKIREAVQENQNPVTYLYHVGQYLPDWHPWEDYQHFFVQDKRSNGCREIFAIELPWMIQTFGKITDIHVSSARRTNLKINYQDSYLVQLTHENGTQGVFAVDVTCREAVRHLELYNEELFIEWRGTPDTLWYKNLDTNQMEHLDAVSEYAREEGYSTFVNEYAYVNEIREFFRVLEHPEDPQATRYGFAEDYQTLQLIDRIEK